MKLFVSLALLALLSSCSFNKLFYRPDKLPQNLTVVTIHNKENPTDTMLLHLDGPEHNASLTDTKGQPKNIGYHMRSVTFPGARGHKLFGWLFTPDNFPDPKISMLFLHGNAGNLLSEFAFAIPFVKRGFQVFVIDYSGYGFSEGKATRKNMLADGNAALHYLHAMPETQGTRLLIYGQSIGGQLTYPVAAENESILDGIVTEGAPSSHKDIARHYAGVFGFLAPVLVKDRYNAFTSVRKFHKPVLVIHSTEDETVPYRMGQKIYANANNPKSFYTIDHPHITGPEFYADSIARRIRAMVP